MASRSIVREIKCEHAKECRSYSVWIGDGKFSKCVNCRNNKYQNPERMKEDFYEPDTETWLINTITKIAIVCALIGLCVLIFWI